MVFPNKKPGIGIEIGIGRPKDAPAPPKGMKGIPGGDEPDEPEAVDNPEEEESEEDPTECLKRVESKLDLIMHAMGLDGQQGGEEDEGSGEMPDDGGGNGAMA